MNFETLQKSWQSQNTAAKVMINTDFLLNEVRRNQKHLRTTIFWRDARGIAVALGLGSWFLHHAMRDHDWLFCLLAFVLIGCGIFTVVDRLLRRGKQPAPDDSLKTCTESSLSLLNHQIWLRKTFARWGVWLFTAALGVFAIYSAWHRLGSGAWADTDWLIEAILIGLAVWGAYCFGLLAVRNNLEPRRQELEALLGSLSENSK